MTTTVLVEEQRPQTASEAGRHLAARRRIVDRVCQYSKCGKVFQGLKRAKYCSTTHARQAAYERNDGAALKKAERRRKAAQLAQAS